MHKENSGEGRSGIEIFMKRRARGGSCYNTKGKDDISPDGCWGEGMLAYWDMYIFLVPGGLHGTLWA